MKPLSENVPDTVLTEVDADTCAVTENRVETTLPVKRYLFVPLAIRAVQGHSPTAAVTRAGRELIYNLISIFAHGYLFFTSGETTSDCLAVVKST